MKQIILSLIILSLLGCSTPDITHAEPEQATNINQEEVSQGNFHFDESKSGMKTDNFDFLDKELPKNINFYIRGLMQDIIANLQYINETTPVAVTSFVFLDGDYQQTSLLGNQISESLTHEIHKAGIPVLDFKVTNRLKVTEQGDFILSRDYRELSRKIPINYIVTGSLVKHKEGYLVNARVVGLSSKAVVGSAQSFIPAHVANALLSSTLLKESQPVPLIQ
ncbi:MAG: hypothetical protein GY951_18505 [Psychromonas sp.]|nr:hypothetical protein [Alteromonadales bacterium]MCP5080023.1 hypothetical protein [Psychromonas sp.]